MSEKGGEGERCWGKGEGGEEGKERWKKVVNHTHYQHVEARTQTFGHRTQSSIPKAVGESNTDREGGGVWKKGGGGEGRRRWRDEKERSLDCIRTTRSHQATKEDAGQAFARWKSEHQAKGFQQIITLVIHLMRR